MTPRIESAVREFLDRVNMTTDNEGGSTYEERLEIAYDRHIAGKIDKSQFLNALRELAPEVHDSTVDHLMVPINWSHLKMRSVWGIKNTATGNLISLRHDREEDVFHLRETAVHEDDDLEFAPMLTANKEDAGVFVQSIQNLEPDEDKPMTLGDSMVSVRLESGLNPMNFEVCSVRCIF